MEKQVSYPNRAAFVILWGVFFPLIMIAQGGWTPLGPDDFARLSAGPADYIRAAAGANGELYVVFQDASIGSKATVRRYRDTTWTVVGSPDISVGVAKYTDIAVDGDVPYIVYQDVAAGSKATVQRFNGADWVTVGEVGLSTAVANETRIAVAPDGTPYVVYRDVAEGSKATVKKFNGADWIGVGAPGISDGFALSASIAIGMDGVPYIVYGNYGGGSKATVKKYNGVNWVNAGNPNFSAGVAEFTEIAISPSNIPYVIYRDVAAGYKATVKNLTGTIWQTVGMAGFSEGNIQSPSIAIEVDGTPWVVYRDLPAGRPIVKRLVNEAWETVIEDAFSQAGGANTVLEITSAGKVCVAYRAEGNRATVSCFNGTDWTRISPGSITGLFVRRPSISWSGSSAIGFVGASNSEVVGYINGNWKSLGGLNPNHVFFGDFSISLAGDDTPFAAYMDGEQPIVKKWNGTDWEDVGSIPPAAIQLSSLSFALAPDDIPFLATIDNSDGLTSQIIIRRFNGTEWEDISGSNFAEEGIHSSIQLKVSEDNVPFVAYREEVGVTNKIVVKAFDGLAWATLGTPFQITPPNLIFFDFAVSFNHIPYVLYEDFDHRPAVRRFFNGEWEELGVNELGDFLYSSGQLMELALEGNIPYVVIQGPQNDWRALVRRFNGLEWETLGDTFFSAALVNSADLTITPDHTLLVAYDSDGLFVKKYQLPCTTAVTTIVFSPVSCFGETDGVLVASATSGAAPFSYLWNTGAEQDTIGGLAAGNYSLTVQDNGRCPANASISLAEPLPLEIEIDGPEIVKEDETALFTAVASAGSLQYAWESMPEGLTEGQNTPSAHFRFAELGPAEIRLTVVDTNGCMAADTLRFEVSMINATQNLASPMKMKVWPNPCIDHLFLDLGGLPPQEGVIDLFDARGRLIWRHPVENLSALYVQISMEGLSSGVYVLRFTGPAGSEAVKFLKVDFH